jgi:hypothetical protein
VLYWGDFLVDLPTVACPSAPMYLFSPLLASTLLIIPPIISHRYNSSNSTAIFVWSLIEPGVYKGILVQHLARQRDLSLPAHPPQGILQILRRRELLLVGGIALFGYEGSVSLACAWMGRIDSGRLKVVRERGSGSDAVI